MMLREVTRRVTCPFSCQILPHGCLLHPRPRGTAASDTSRCVPETAANSPAPKPEGQWAAPAFRGLMGTPGLGRLETSILSSREGRRRSPARHSQLVSLDPGVLGHQSVHGLRQDINTGPLRPQTSGLSPWDILFSILRLPWWCHLAQHRHTHTLSVPTGGTLVATKAQQGRPGSEASGQHG